MYYIKEILKCIFWKKVYWSVSAKETFKYTEYTLFTITIYKRCKLIKYLGHTL